MKLLTVNIFNGFYLLWRMSSARSTCCEYFHIHVWVCCTNTHLVKWHIAAVADATEHFQILKFNPKIILKWFFWYHAYFTLDIVIRRLKTSRKVRQILGNIERLHGTFVPPLFCLNNDDLTKSILRFLRNSVISHSRTQTEWKRIFKLSSEWEERKTKLIKRKFFPEVFWCLLVRGGGGSGGAGW